MIKNLIEIVSLKIIDKLKTHPEIGLGAGGTSVGFSFIETITPYAQFVSVMLGMAVLVITLWLKIIDLKEKRNAKRKDTGKAE